MCCTKVSKIFNSWLLWLRVIITGIVAFLATEPWQIGFEKSFLIIFTKLFNAGLIQLGHISK